MILQVSTLSIHRATSQLPLCQRCPFRRPRLRGDAPLGVAPQAVAGGFTGRQDFLTYQGGLDAWMSTCWKLGSKVGKWVRTRIYPIYIAVTSHLDPKFLAHPSASWLRSVLDLKLLCRFFGIFG